MAIGKSLAVALASAAVLALAGTPAFAGDAAAGKKVFKKYLCSVCHKMEPGKNGVGPSLAGIFGSKAGVVKGYRFSKALKDSGIVWNEANLNEWLQSPKKMVKGTKMNPPRLVKNATDRENLIAYLKEATDK